MPNKTRSSGQYALQFLLALLLAAPAPGVSAEEPVEEPAVPVESPAPGPEVGIELGILTVIGTDLRVSYYQPDTSWVFGFRYLNIKDDFINEGAAGLPSDSSDKVYTTAAGFYANHLFNSAAAGSFYAGGEILQETIKLECDTFYGVSESDSTRHLALYFGGGYQRPEKNGFGYNIGMYVSPFAHYKLSTSTCSSDSSGGFDVSVSVTYTF